MFQWKLGSYSYLILIISVTIIVQKLCFISQTQFCLCVGVKLLCSSAAICCFNAELYRIRSIHQCPLMFAGDYCLLCGPVRVCFESPLGEVRFVSLRTVKLLVSVDFLPHHTNITLEKISSAHVWICYWSHISRFRCKTQIWELVLSAAVIVHLQHMYEARRTTTQSVKLPIFQLPTSNGGVESGVERSDRAAGDDLDTCSHSARDSAPRAQPIQI